MSSAVGSLWRRGLACGAVAVVIVLGANVAPASAQSGQAWWERIRFGGDFRVRQEGFFQEGAPTRQRFRFRLRATLDTDINDDLSFGLRLGSGDLGTPVSTNQTFANLLTRKPISVDRVFMTYNPTGAKALTLGGGKFALPVGRTEMTFDNDINWEGVYERVGGSAGPWSYRLVAAQVALVESSSEDDAILLAAFGELDFTFGAHELDVSAANYSFRGVDAVAVAIDVEGIGRNTNALRVDEDGRVVGFASGYNLVDVIARATFDTGREHYPLQLVANVVKNIDAASDEDRGVWLTVAYGSASAPRTYRLDYTYAHIERDAVLSVFTFSDSLATNTWMHRSTVTYMVAPHVHLDFIGIFSKKLVTAPGELNTLLKRTHVDVRLSF